MFDSTSEWLEWVKLAESNFIRALQSFQWIYIIPEDKPVGLEWNEDVLSKFSLEV